ncbi:MAG TPA: hypothetical protein VF546_01310 [Pyrinomonadaceae bacterium]|jgi:hypothetical protein
MNAMFGRQNPQSQQSRLDRAGRALVRAAAANDEAFEQAAAAPHALGALRARIAAERLRRAEADDGWLAVLSVARRAVPALTAFAALALALMLWLAGVGGATQAPAPLPLSDDALFEARDAGVEQTVLAGPQNLSRDEVLRLVVERAEQNTH